MPLHVCLNQDSVHCRQNEQSAWVSCKENAAKALWSQVGPEALQPSPALTYIVLRHLGCCLLFEEHRYSDAV